MGGFRGGHDDFGSFSSGSGSFGGFGGSTEAVLEAADQAVAGNHTGY